MYLLDNPIRSYAWGSRSALADLLGLPTSDTPEAELWLGAHPSAPSRLPDGTSLLAAIQADPVGLLGVECVAEFGPTLPFLLKVLAADEPLSLQAHPGPEQAAAGYAEEQARGVPIDSPQRSYRDPRHKPELICALAPFVGLCGFRPVAETLALLDELDVDELQPILGTLRRQPDAVGLREAVALLLGTDGGGLVAAVGASCARLAGSGGSFRWVARLAQLYPGDAAVVVSLLLNLVELAPGEALYLPAGNLHAYLRGVAVEVMANSDNVLRGGLTDKHVDVDQLLPALDTSPAAVRILTGDQLSPGEWAYRTAAREFGLSRFELSGAELTLVGGGPQIVLVTAGGVVLDSGPAELVLDRGGSAYLQPSDANVTVRGTGVLYRATIPRAPSSA